ncbi:CBS domain-containing protein [Chloroflexota bacterium]
MLVSDVMSTNVVSISIHTSLAEARRILDSHGFRRLAVMDKEKLVGIVTKEALDRTGPSQLTTFSIHEMSYLLNKITVEQAMRKDVVTVSPHATVEEAVALAQDKKVGSLLVVEDQRLIGIVTTNDFFYKVMNHILGIGMTGSRIVVRDCYKGPDIIKVLAAINEVGLGITTLFTIELPEVQKHDLVIHLDQDDCRPAVAEIQRSGYRVRERSR